MGNRSHKVMCRGNIGVRDRGHIGLVRGHIGVGGQGHIGWKGTAYG